MSTAPDVLVVASMRRWVADDFAAPAARAGLPLVHSWGLDVPDVAPHARPAWWAPTEHAARLLRAGQPLPLVAPGPSWLSRVPRELTGRAVWSGPLADIAQAPPSGFAKPAEAKVAALPAQWWDAVSDFAAAAAAAGLPPATRVQVSPTRLDLAVEHRCVVVNATVLTSSPYLLADGTTWFEGMETQPGLGGTDAEAFARDVVAALGADQPPAYTLDVARTAAGCWVVLEGNPAWSSAAYGCDMDAVLECVLACADYGGEHRGWHWQPDPWLVQRAAAQGLLRRA